MGRAILRHGKENKRQDQDNSRGKESRRRPHSSYHQSANYNRRFRHICSNCRRSRSLDSLTRLEAMAKDADVFIQNRPYTGLLCSNENGVPYRCR